MATTEDRSLPEARSVDRKGDSRSRSVSSRRDGGWRSWSRIPDDPEFYISGTLLRLKASGAKMLIVLTTDGGRRTTRRSPTNVEENRKVRRQEQIDAAKAYDAEVAFLDGPDGRYNPDAAAQAKLREALREFDPEIVLTFDGDYPPKVQHRDHRNSGIAAEAIVAGTSTQWILRFGTRAPNLYVDTSDLWEKRSELLAIHKSQFFGDRLEMIRGMVQERAMETGEVGGFRNGRSVPRDEVKVAATLRRLASLFTGKTPGLALVL